MRKRSKVLSAASLGLALVCAGQPVVAAPAAPASAEAAQPEKKRNSGQPVGVWIAIGTVFFLAITAAARRRRRAGKST